MLWLCIIRDLSSRALSQLLQNRNHICISVVMTPTDVSLNRAQPCCVVGLDEREIGNHVATTVLEQPRVGCPGKRRTENSSSCAARFNRGEEIRLHSAA